MSWRRRLLHAMGRLSPGVLRALVRLKSANPLLQRLVSRVGDQLRGQAVTIPHGAGSGLRFNAGRSNLSYALGTNEEPVQEALVRLLRPGDILYDIGANVGFFSLIGARLVGPTGHVYAFEPAPENVATLKENAARNGFTNVTVLAKAAAASSGPGTLVLSDIPTVAWLSRDNEDEAQRPTLPVELSAVDDLVASGEVAPPAVVKIDVEGAEIDVITGMTATIGKHRPIILCEMHGTNKDFGALMEKLDYDVTALEEPGPIEEASWWVHALAMPRPGA